MCEHDELGSKNHMFFHFPFTKLCWQYLCPSLTPTQQIDIQSIIASLKNELKVPFFMELIVLTTWAIWTTPNVYKCRKTFKDELALLVHKKPYASLKI
jgi:hypothetical protein